MHWQYTPFSLLYLVSGLISLGLAGYTWRRRAVAGALPFALLMLGGAVWSLASAVVIARANLAHQVFWNKVIYVGVVMMPPAWLCFALAYTGRTAWLTRRTLSLLALPPLITLLLVFTVEQHTLIWTRVWLDTSGPYTVLGVIYGGGFWIWGALGYSALLVGTGLIVWMLLHRHFLYRGQAVALLIGVCMPWVGNAIYLSGVSPLPQLDLTPLMLTASGLAITWGAFRFRLFDIVPVAHEHLIASMCDAMLVIDRQDRLVDLNPAAQTLFGRPAAELIGQSVTHLLHGRPDLLAHYGQLPAAHGELVLGTGEERRTFDLHMSPLEDRHGQMQGRLVVLYDVTERKRLEALRDDLTHMMLHDLRNPLGNVSVVLQLLKTILDGMLQPEDRELLQSAQHNVDTLFGLVNALLDISQLESGDMPLQRAPIALDELVATVMKRVSALAADKGVQLECAVPAAIWSAWCDPDLIQRVLQNLLGNAITFTPPGGIVRVEAHAEGIEPQHRLLVTVSDTGPGIAPHIQERLFQKFVSGQQKGSGSGLGLAFCQLVIAAHGERIWVENRPGHGARFLFTLPVSPFATPHAEIARGAVDAGRLASVH